jgi:hypothetical protein
MQLREFYWGTILSEDKLLLIQDKTEPHVLSDLKLKLFMQWEVTRGGSCIRSP